MREYRNPGRGRQWREAASSEDILAKRAEGSLRGRGAGVRGRRGSQTMLSRLRFSPTPDPRPPTPFSLLLLFGWFGGLGWLRLRSFHRLGSFGWLGRLGLLRRESFVPSGRILGIGAHAGNRHSKNPQAGDLESHPPQAPRPAGAENWRNRSERSAVSRENLIYSRPGNNARAAWPSVTDRGLVGRNLCLSTSFAK